MKLEKHLGLEVVQEVQEVHGINLTSNRWRAALLVASDFKESSSPHSSPHSFPLPGAADSPFFGDERTQLRRPVRQKGEELGGPGQCSECRGRNGGDWFKLNFF